MKKAELVFTVIMVPVDFCLVLLAAITAYYWRFGWLAGLRPVIFDLPFSVFFKASLIAAAIFVIIFALAGLYTTFGPRRLKHEINRILIASAAAVLVLIAVIFFQRELFQSRFIIIAAWLFSFLYVSLGRIMVRLLQRMFLRYGIGTYRVAIIGGDDRATKTLLEEFAKNLSSGHRVISVYGHFDSEAESELDEMVKNDELDEIMVTDTGIGRLETSRVFGFAQSRHLTFKYTADPLATQSRNLEVGVIAGIPMVEIKNTRLDGWGRVFKRLFDIVISLILLILLSPVLIITAIAVKLSSKGPVFYRLDDDSPVRRVGEHGKPFRYIKFRSMKIKTDQMRYKELAEQDTRVGPLVKIKDDPRITRVGHFIRRWSIDELPELFLVLIGKISLVGPRPHLPEEVAKYDNQQRRVMTVKPGITGMAQVSGRSDLNFDEEVRLDIWYIENWSPWLDMAILLKTPWAIISRRKAS